MIHLYFQSVIINYMFVLIIDFEKKRTQQNLSRTFDDKKTPNAFA